MQRKVLKLLPNTELKMRGDDQSFAPFVELGGFFPSPPDSGVSIATMKEVVVFKNPPVIHIYNIVEYGRRFFRTLAYTSNSSLCIHDVEGDPYPDRVLNVLSLSAGSPWGVVKPTPSLLIMRR